MCELTRSVMGLYVLTGDHIQNDLPKALKNFLVSENAIERHNKRINDKNVME